MDCDRCGKHIDTSNMHVADLGFVLIYNRLFGGYVCKDCDRKLTGNLTTSGDVYPPEDEELQELLKDEGP